MTPLNRRKALLALSSLLLTPQTIFAKTKAKIVIIGGGFGGASAALALKLLMPKADIKLIEPNKTYYACPFSNFVISNVRDMQAQAFGYAGLKARNITVIHDYAKDIDPFKQTVSLQNNVTRLPYDRLILSPGIDMQWNAIKGYDIDAAQIFPHAWKAGLQTLNLQKQLLALEDGGVILMSVPRALYRCPPGPYERASLIAHYLQTQKPRSKLIILDAKDSFSKQALFEEAWAQNYQGIIEWRSASNDGIVQQIDIKSNTISTDFEDFSPGVANIIPPQKAAIIAMKAGVTDSTEWCPINATSFESRLQQNIHIIGDAAIANPMPKSAFSANLQAKLCAIQVARLLSGLTLQPTTLTNTCYSFVAPDKAVSITGVYKNHDTSFTQLKGAGGTSPLNAKTDMRVKEAEEARIWFKAITQEAFG